MSVRDQRWPYKIRRIYPRSPASARTTRCRRDGASNPGNAVDAGPASSRGQCREPCRLASDGDQVVPDL